MVLGGPDPGWCCVGSWRCHGDLSAGSLGLDLLGWALRGGLQKGRGEMRWGVGAAVQKQPLVSDEGGHSPHLYPAVLVCSCVCFFSSTLLGDGAMEPGDHSDLPKVTQ